MGPHFGRKSLDSIEASNPRFGHALCMDLSELLERTRPPDSELVDLIEQAYLDGQIDGQKVDLAYSWPQANREVFIL